MYIARLIGCPIVHSRITLRSNLGLPGHWVIVQRICWIPGVRTTEQTVCSCDVFRNVFRTSLELLYYLLTKSLSRMAGLGSRHHRVVVGRIYVTALFEIFFHSVCKGLITGKYNTLYSRWWLTLSTKYLSPSNIIIGSCNSFCEVSIPWIIVIVSFGSLIHCETKCPDILFRVVISARVRSAECMVRFFD